LDISWFFTDNIAVELIAATTRHTLTATGTALGNVDVGSTLGAAANLDAAVSFHAARAAQSLCRRRPQREFLLQHQGAGPTITGLSVNDSWGPAIQAGVDYNFSGHWFANLDVKQIILNTAAHVSAGALHIKAKDSLDPLVVGAGIGYRS
jgi:outer membrane protein